MTEKEVKRAMDCQDEIFRLARRLVCPEARASKRDLRRLLLLVAEQADAMAALCEEVKSLRSQLEAAQARRSGIEQGRVRTGRREAAARSREGRRSGAAKATLP